MIKKSFLNSLLLLAFIPSSATAKEVVTWDEIARELDRTEVSTPQLDFALNLQQAISKNGIALKKQQISHLQSLRQGFEPKNSCQAVALNLLDTIVEAEQMKVQLDKAQLKNRESYQGSIASLKDHEFWYRYLTFVWLGESVPTDELYKIGEDAFNEAISQFRLINRQATHSQPSILDSDDGQAIQKKYDEVDEIVKQHLAQQFVPQAGVADLNIARSLQGSNFPAPGYYSPINQTMYYHPLKATYDLQQVDWLYLHEGVPGHHYQSQVAALSDVCKEIQLNQSVTHGRMAFVEGWAAYVETLGKELGLLQNPRSHQFVLKWQALRAMRVMIDVGIHAKGWTDDQAQAHWLQHFPEGADVMNREINRIKRWPMQVNTYVYGKHKIEQLKHHLIADESNNFDVRVFHRNLLNISHLPIHILNHYAKLFEHQEKTL